MVEALACWLFSLCRGPSMQQAAVPDGLGFDLHSLLEDRRPCRRRRRLASGCRSSRDGGDARRPLWARSGPCRHGGPEGPESKKCLQFVVRRRATEHANRPMPDNDTVPDLRPPNGRGCRASTRGSGFSAASAPHRATCDAVVKRARGPRNHRFEAFTPARVILDLSRDV